MDAAGMAKAIVCDEEGIGNDDELMTGQIATTYESMKMYLAVQWVGPILVEPSITMKARPLEQWEFCSIDHEIPVSPLRAYLLSDPCLRSFLLLSCRKVDIFIV
jgi:hypothetical protein